MLLCIALATNFVGSKSQAQTDPTHRFTSGDVIGTTIKILVEGDADRQDVYIDFDESVILTVTNNHPNVVDLRFNCNRCTPITMMVFTIDSSPFESGLLRLDAGNDDTVDDENYEIVFTWRRPSSTSNTASVTLTGTVTDNDAASADYTLSTLGSLTEGGNTTFTAVLDARPASDVVLTLTSSATSVATVAPALLTFTNSDWNAAQTVNVAGVDNDLIDGDRDYTITVAVNSGPGSYGTLANKELTGTVTDDDAADYTLSALGSLTEGGSTTFTAVLDAQPISDVVLTLTSSATSVATVTPALLTFTNSDWETAQMVNVAGVNNAIIGDQDYTITVANSGPGGYATLANKELTGTVTDDDAANADYTLSTLANIAEGGSTTFTAVLDAQPASNVVLTLTSSATSVATATPTLLTFTNSDWNAAQTVDVSGVNNDLIDGDRDYTITVDVDGPGGYGTLANKELTGTVTDDDATNADYTLNALGSLTEGGSTTFTAVLAAQPASDVVLTLTSSATSVATVVPALLTFSNSDWSTAQTVSVSGVNNDLIDGSRNYIITVAVNSGPGGYGTLTNKELTGTATDDDAAGITFSTGPTLPSLSRDETITFTTVLTAQPNSNVVLTLTSSTTVVATVEPALLTFTSSDSNWNTAQTITVTAEENAAEEITSYTITVAVVDASSDVNFGGR